MVMKGELIRLDLNLFGQDENAAQLGDGYLILQVRRISDGIYQYAAGLYSRRQTQQRNQHHQEALGEDKTGSPLSASGVCRTSQGAHSCSRPA